MTAMRLRAFHRAIGASGSWSSASLLALASDSNNWNNYTHRQYIGAPVIPKNGSKIRVTWHSSTAEGLKIAKAYIGLKGATTLDFAGTPTQITFGGGSTSGTVALDTDLVSDDITFAITTSNNIVISFWTDDPTADSFRNVNAAGVNFEYAFKSGGDDAATLTATGYTNIGDYQAIKAFEVFG